MRLCNFNLGNCVTTAQESLGNAAKQACGIPTRYQIHIAKSKYENAVSVYIVSFHKLYVVIPIFWN